jgi:hypothetical protein
MTEVIEYQAGEPVPQRGVYAVFSGHLYLGQARFAPFTEFPPHPLGNVTYRLLEAA